MEKHRTIQSDIKVLCLQSDEPILLMRSVTERHASTWAGMAGLRHKQRHKASRHRCRYQSEARRAAILAVGFLGLPTRSALCEMQHSNEGEASHPTPGRHSAK